MFGLAAIIALTWWLGPFWRGTAFLCVLAHYLHDAALMKDDGIGWFLRRQPAYWTRLGKVEPADPNHEHWIRVNFLEPSTLAMIEVAIGSVTFGIAVGIMLNDPWRCLSVPFLLWVLASTFWSIWETQFKQKGA
jgi:hypothetical protein